ncbi:hypothetical protein ICY20_01950 [Pseudomonas sp. P115]|uniref:hypothetical protein n=1 Tax=Pseudomonas pisciculturae TaxID=2730413 RepID=UPI0018924140|nr:hypothetical protein [Pseudomonas pisciculturae]MBF6026477.1 hypothetical protein [Pseudomonas pisciculturae]
MSTTEQEEADYKVSLSAKTNFTTPHAAKFKSSHIELHSLFGQLDFVIDLNKSSPQSHRSLELSFSKDIPTGTYSADGSDGLFYQLLYREYRGRADDSEGTDFLAKSGKVRIETTWSGYSTRFILRYDVITKSAEGKSISLKGKTVIYAEFFP